MEIQIDAQKLDRINKGTNFLNLNNDYQKKNYWISVLLEVTQDLTEKEEKIIVSHNLPLKSDYYERYESVESFLKKLKAFVNLPLGRVIIPNKDTKRCEIGSYELRAIENHIRENHIAFEDIDITIGELARKRIDIDFVGEVKKILKILDEQVKDNKQERIDAYVRLKTKIENLKKLLCKERESYYCYSQKKDETIKMPLTAEEYNSKLKEVEKELRTLEKEFDLKKEDLDYIKIKEGSEKGFDSWLKENEEELREQFESGDSEDMTFEEYADMCYENRDDSEE